MADIISLNKARKQRKKAEQQSQAASNRGVFGLTKAEKSKNQADKGLESSKLDGLRIFRPERGDGDDND